jgi:hypothetical protein
LAAAAIVSVGVATPVLAHHSFGAFDRTKEMTVTGTVKEWKWSNPHPFMAVSAEGKPSADPAYTFEFGAPVQLQARGYTRKMVKVGDKVILKYNPWRNGDPGGLFTDITSADGKSLKTRQ